MFSSPLSHVKCSVTGTHLASCLFCALQAFSLQLVVYPRLPGWFWLYLVVPSSGLQVLNQCLVAPSAGLLPQSSATLLVLNQHSHPGSHSIGLIQADDSGKSISSCPFRRYNIGCMCVCCSMKDFCSLHEFCPVGG